jgi:tetratricopeptide (TPR) repeat protein
MVRLIRSLALTLALGLVILWIGCGDKGTCPELTAESMTAEGWALFETGDFASAISKFEAAISTDTTYADAYNGLGWSHLRLDSLNRSISDFTESLSRGLPTVDPYAGQAIAYRDHEPPGCREAITSADSALHRDLRYVFLHAQELDWRDLRLILTQCYFETGEYDLAKTQVDSLNPDNVLDPDLDTFVADLLTEIQRLTQEFSGS